MLIPLLLKGLLAALIVGFVTASIQSWVDRFFLVIMLVGIVGLPIQEDVTVNLSGALLRIPIVPSPPERGTLALAHSARQAIPVRPFKSKVDSS
ncbi:MAG: hypothetical protein ACK4VW_00075 [Anaerolineales bacterium]